MIDSNNLGSPEPEVVELNQAKQHHHQPQGIEEIGRNFYLDNPTEITNYLVANAALIPILQDAHCQIRQVFKSQAKLSLKLCCDPDVPDWNQLTLSIHVGCDAQVERICSLKESLDDNWWIDVYSLVPNLNINVSFDDL
ncbi:MAG: hypothetical protein AAF652_10595 [Cyanobacteria bacterium P01_C01_bin.72]